MREPKRLNVLHVSEETDNADRFMVVPLGGAGHHANADVLDPSADC
jgi:methylmalonyl-CoA mutase cobalamin-binding subunit